MVMNDAAYAVYTCEPLWFRCLEIFTDVQRWLVH